MRFVVVRTLAVVTFGALVAAMGTSTAAAQDIDFGIGGGKPKTANVRKKPKSVKPKPKPGEPVAQPVEPVADDPPAKAVEHYEAGNIAYDRNELETAIREYEKAISLHSRYTDALIELGGAYYDLSDLDQAEDAWRRALRLDDKIPEVHNNLGNLLYVQHDYDAALASYKRAVQLRPAYYDALFGLGNTLVALKRFDEAIPNFELAIASRSLPFPDAEANLAWAFVKAGRLDEAEASARKAIANFGPQSEQSVKAWYALANVLTTKGNLTEGADALRQSIAVCTGCPASAVSRIHLSLATVLEATGDKPGAANALEEYLRLAPFVSNEIDIRERIRRLRGN